MSSSSPPPVVDGGPFAAGATTATTTGAVGRPRDERETHAEAHGDVGAVVVAGGVPHNTANYKRLKTAYKGAPAAVLLTPSLATLADVYRADDRENNGNDNIGGGRASALTLPPLPPQLPSAATTSASNGNKNKNKNNNKITTKPRGTLGAYEIATTPTPVATTAAHHRHHAFSPPSNNDADAQATMTMTMTMTMTDGEDEEDEDTVLLPPGSQLASLGVGRATIHSFIPSFRLVLPRVHADVQVRFIVGVGRGFETYDER